MLTWPERPTLLQANLAAEGARKGSALEGGALAAAPMEALHGVDGKNSTAPPTPSPSVQVRRHPPMCGRRGHAVPRPAAGPLLRSRAV
jgi:hypothetical protein